MSVIVYKEFKGEEKKTLFECSSFLEIVQNSKREKDVHEGEMQLNVLI